MRYRLRQLRLAIHWLPSPRGQFTVMGLITAFIIMLGLIQALASVQLYEVYLDGELLGIVEDGELATYLYDYYVARAQSESPLEVFPCEVVHVVGFRDRGEATISPPVHIAQELIRRLTFVTRASAIVVDGEEVVALPSLALAQQVVEDIRLEYIQSLESGGQADVTSAYFNQDITIEARFYELEAVQSEELARQLLTSGTDEVRVHVVQRGDSLWSIASATGTPLAQLEQANPHLSNPSRVRPGDEVSLVVARPFVSLSSQETLTVTRPIPFSTRVVSESALWSWQRIVSQRGVAGSTQRTYIITRRDGREVGRVLAEETILSQPVEQIISQGTRQVPQHGTGSYLWPVVGNITSPFGPRWRGFHSGVDIAATVGTPVKAADAGTVVTASYMGAYGNTVMVDHGGGRIVTLYAHLSRMVVVPGEVVGRGQVVGYVGTTGRSTGPHLHFEVRLDDQPVDPAGFYDGQN